MTAALVILGLLALAVFSPGFRAVVLALIAICLVAGASFVVWDWHESGQRTRVQEQERQLQEQERQLARSRLSQADIEFADLTLSSSSLQGRLRNKSSVYGVGSVGLKIVVQDCVPPTAPAPPQGRCEVVGEHLQNVSALVPPGQARDFSEYISWWGQIRLRNEFKWSYEIEYIEASKPTQEEEVIIKAQLIDQASLRRRAMELLPQMSTLERPGNGEFADLGLRPEDTLRNPQFRATFNAALAHLPLMGSEANSWISRLELVAGENEIISVPRLGNILLVSGCKPHFCDQRVYIVYSPSRRVLFGMARFSDGRWHLFGTIDADARAIALVAYARDESRSNVPIPGVTKDADGNFVWDKSRAGELGLAFPLSDSVRPIVAGVLSTIQLDGMSAPS